MIVPRALWHRYVLYALGLVLTFTVIVKARLASDLSSLPYGPIRRDVPRDVVTSLADGWTLHSEGTVDGRINSLHACSPDFPVFDGVILAGMSEVGSIYRIQSGLGYGRRKLAALLGDWPQDGVCNVNRLAMHDLDHDGVPEIIATTSQVLPIGRPRLYIWSREDTSMVQRAMTRPAIRSSWSHSLGFLPRTGRGADSIFVTYCGYGEVVEFRYEPSQPGAGFQRDAIDWKVVAQLPASGEWLQLADADNDGAPDVCVATGYATHGAELLIYESPEAGAMLRVKHRIDEDHAFGNVRFLVAASRNPQERDVYAWWCTDLAGGDATMIRYRLGPDGVRERTVLARGNALDLWPDDNQFAEADLDADGRAEVWFTTHGGQLWRIDAGSELPPTLISRFSKSLGPIAAAPRSSAQPEQLLLGLGSHLLTLRANPAPPTLIQAARAKRQAARPLTPDRAPEAPRG